MTAVILQLRDYKTKDERQAEIDRTCLAAVSEALGDQDTAPAEYCADWPDSGDCA